MEVVTLSINALHTPTKTYSFGSVDTPKETDAAKDENLSFLPISEVSTAASTSSSLRFSVPPTTPAPQFSFSHLIASLTYPFPNLRDVSLPYIREVGIKTSMEILSEHFSCQDYKLNQVQFWFLDIIIDCLWKLQDEFHFPERYQKGILEWIIYAIDIIRDHKHNFSRKKFFQVFEEILYIINEKIQTGCDMLPTPTDLFSFIQDGEEEEISFPSESEQSSNVSLTSDGESFVAVGIDENTEIFKLPKPFPKCDQSDESIDKNWVPENHSTKEICGCESIEFYKASDKTPERFQSSSSSSVSSSSSSISTEIDTPKTPRIGPQILLLLLIAVLEFHWKQSSLSSERIPKICSLDRVLPISSLNNSESPSFAYEEWTKYLNKNSDYLEDIEKNITINSCAVFAIKQFIYDYFHETFQYTIIKKALINNFNTITQEVNYDWKVPKVLKEEIKKPKMKKEKKKKKAKPKKKPRKKTKSKKDKKRKKKPKAKKAKKKKTPKKKLTKEEKAELLRQKREQERLEEEFRKAEQNRRMLFPLKDATDDSFFRSIFTHWKKPHEKKKGKKKKK